MTEPVERLPEFTAREIECGAAIIALLRSCRDVDEALNVVVIAAKAVVEPDVRHVLLPNLGRVSLARRHD